MLTVAGLIAWTIVLICWNIRSEKIAAVRLINPRAANTSSGNPVGKPTNSGL